MGQGQPPRRQTKVSFYHVSNSIKIDPGYLLKNLTLFKSDRDASFFRNMCRNDHEGQAIDWNGLNLMMASVDKITKEENSLACRCTFVFSRFFDMDQFENLRMGVSTERTIGMGF